MADTKWTALPPVTTPLSGSEVTCVVQAGESRRATITQVRSSAFFQGAFASPTGTSSTAGVMMGLPGTIVPVGTGRIHITISGNVWNNTVNGGAIAAIRYASTALITKPINGQSDRGTSPGGAFAYYRNGAANLAVPFSISAIVTGLTIGTTYWLDALLAVVSGSGAMDTVAITAFEF